MGVACIVKTADKMKSHYYPMNLWSLLCNFLKRLVGQKRCTIREHSPCSVKLIDISNFSSHPVSSNRLSAFTVTLQTPVILRFTLNLNLKIDNKH